MLHKTLLLTLLTSSMQATALGNSALLRWHNLQQTSNLVTPIPTCGANGKWLNLGPSRKTVNFGEWSFELPSNLENSYVELSQTGPVAIWYNIRITADDNITGGDPNHPPSSIWAWPKDKLLIQIRFSPKVQSNDQTRAFFLDEVSKDKLAEKDHPAFIGEHPSWTDIFLSGTTFLIYTCTVVDLGSQGLLMRLKPAPDSSSL